MSFTTTQKKVLSILPHVTAVFSLVGSGSIVCDVLRDRKTKLRRTYFRLLFAFSSFDLLTSVWFGMSTWPIPAHTEGVYAALGTTATCTAQGFFLQLSLISPLYNSMLAVYYVLLGRYDVPEDVIAAKYEPYMHLTASMVAVGFAVAGLGLEIYNNANLWCWIASLPSDCQGLHGEETGIPCERGEDAWLYRWVFFYGPLWFTIILVTVLMVLLTCSVRQDEARAMEFEERRIERQLSVLESQHATTLRRKFERTRQMFKQALWYVGAFYLTWVAATINRLVQLSKGEGDFVFMLLTTIFAPAQGFFNFMVYRHGPCVA